MRQTERQTITDANVLFSLIPSWYGLSFAFDVETTGLVWKKDRLLGLALAFEDGRSYYIVLEHTMPLEDKGDSVLVAFISSEDFEKALRPLFSQQNILMVAHNAKFDMHFLQKYKTPVEGRLADTLLAAQLLNENKNNGLKFLASEILGFDYSKYHTLAEYDGYSKHEILGVPLERVAEYAMNDVDATLELYNVLSQRLANEVFRDKSLLDVFNDLWMPVLVVLQQMEQRGIALNIEKVKELREHHLQIAKEHEEKVRQEAFRMVVEAHPPTEIPSWFLVIATADELERAYESVEGNLVLDQYGVHTPIITKEILGRKGNFQPRTIKVNLGSPKQVKHLVFDLSSVKAPTEMELKVNKSGEFSADKDNLETLLYFNGEETPQFIRDLLAWRKAEKFISTYLNRFINDSDPLDHYSISTWFALAGDDDNAGGTVSGRLTSRSPNLNL